MIEERNKGQPGEFEFDLVDKMHIPIRVYDFLKSAEFTGVHGIATITLGYSFITVTDNSDDNHVKQGEYNGFIYH